MRVLVVGATGATGQQAVKKLVARGDDVTALARVPSAITERSDRLRVVQGEARDEASLVRATREQDAVLVAFGPRSLKKDDLQEALMRNLVSAMRKNGVKRIVNLSAWGAGATAESAIFVFKIFKALVLRHVFVDKERGEKILFASDLDYVNVCPGRLLNSPRRGGVKASLDGRGIKASLTREDLAEFMVEQLTSPTWVGKSPIVGY